MLIFVAPFCLLSGYGLSLIPRRLLNIALIVIVIPSIVLASMEQRLIHIHTANSQATYAFALAHSDANIFVGTKAKMYRIFKNITGDLNQQRIRSIDELATGKIDILKLNDYLIFDTQTFDKKDQKIIKNLFDDKTLCLAEKEKLEPSDIGIEWSVLKSISTNFRKLPEPVASILIKKTEDLLQPKPAFIYLVSSLETCQ